MTDDTTQSRRPRRLESEAAKHLDEWCAAFGRDPALILADAARSGAAVAERLLLERFLPAVPSHAFPIELMTPERIDEVIEILFDCGAFDEFLHTER